MASLQQKGDRFYCQFLYHGKRHTFTVGRVSRDEAETKAAQVDYLLMRIKQRLVTVPPGVDIVTFVEFDGKSPEKDGAPLPPPETVTLGGLRDRYLETHGNGAMEANSLSTVRMHLNHFTTTLGQRFPLSELTQPDLQRHVDRRAQVKTPRGKLSPVTIKKELASLRAMWNWAVHAGLLTGHFPSRGLVYPKHDERPPFQTWAEIERRIAAGGLTEAEQAELWNCLFLTKAEIAALLKHVEAHAAHGWVYPMFVFAAHTGARRSEMLRVRLHDVDFKGNTALLHERKRSKGKRTTRRVPLSATLKRVLREWLKEHPGGEYLFCHGGEVARSKKRSRTTGHKGEKTRASTLKGRMGTVRQRERPTFGQLTKDEVNDHFKRTVAGSKWQVLRGWHVLRHSFASNCAAKGVDQRLIDAWLGHQTEEMKKRYRHLIPSTEQEAIRSVFG